MHLKREEYHGGSFNGNDSRKLLKNISILEEIAPPSVRSFVDAMKTFNEVVQSCYGNELSPNYKDKITKFRKCYMKLKINVTPKIHAVFHHIIEFCEMKKLGLGPWSEHTAELVHHYFKTVWSNFNVRDINHPENIKWRLTLSSCIIVSICNTKFTLYTVYDFKIYA